MFSYYPSPSKQIILSFKFKRVGMILSSLTSLFVTQTYTEKKKVMSSSDSNHCSCLGGKITFHFFQFIWYAVLKIQSRQMRRSFFAPVVISLYEKVLQQVKKNNGSCFRIIDYCIWEQCGKTFWSPLYVTNIRITYKFGGSIVDKTFFANI